MSSTQVLNAACVPVDNRVYRLLPVRDSVRNMEDDDYEMMHLDQDDGDDFDLDLPIGQQGDRYFISIHVPLTLTKHIQGQHGRTRKALEEQYNVKIHIPSQLFQDPLITIYGSTKKSVSLTYTSISHRVCTQRLKTESRHFISFPINSSLIRESFLKFKGTILEKYSGVRGIDASIFQKPNKLHVTVTLLVLLDDRDNEQAIAILTKCKDALLKDFNNKEFVVQVKGLEYMNDDPAEVDVLYAKLEELGGYESLQILADKAMKEFGDADLSKKQHDRVKLHVTLMNTLFRDNLESREGDSPRLTFDARSILRDYSDYDFGQMVISEIHISIRYTEANDGYYSALHKIKLVS